MKQSHKVFSAKEPLRQRFHLDSNGISWMNMEDEPPTNESWSAKVLLKASRMLHGEHSVNALQPRDVELTVSSSIHTGTAPTRLVKRHSRLSVSDKTLALYDHFLLYQKMQSHNMMTALGSCPQVDFAKICATTPTVACSACCHGANGQGNGRTAATSSHYHSRRLHTSSRLPSSGLDYGGGIQGKRPFAERTLVLHMMTHLLPFVHVGLRRSTSAHD